MDEITSLGEWIRRRRRRLDLTQSEVATQVGISLSAIRKIENDERRPSKQVAQLLATVLKIASSEQEHFLRVARAEIRVERLESIPALTEPPLPTLPKPHDTFDSGFAVTDPHSVDLASASIPPQHSPIFRSSSFPTPPTPLLGREVEMEAIHQLLANPECRILTLAGPGGVGKTRLALEVGREQARHFVDGVFFVPLAPINSTIYLAQAVADALGIQLSTAHDPASQVIDHLRERELLLVVDNLEHLLSDVELWVALIQSAAGVKLFATSRERLNLPGEWVFDVQGLPITEKESVGKETDSTSSAAVILFAQAARRISPSFQLTAQTADAVQRICRMLEGMPLAIELAAAWVRALSCAEIAHEIESNLDFLATPTRNVPARHRSLHAAFDHSWQLLNAQERQVLAQLSIFRGGFEREAAQQVADADLFILSALVDKSLLYRTHIGRYSMHEVVRQFGWRKVDESGLKQKTERRYAAYFAQLVNQARLFPSKEEKQIWWVRFDQEIHNLREALTWACSSKGDFLLGLTLAAQLSSYWYERQQWLEGRQWLECALQRAPEHPQSQSPEEAILHAKAELGLAYFLTITSEFARAEPFFERARTTFQSHSESRLLAWTLFDMTQLYMTRGEHERAASLAHESLAIFQRLHDQAGIAHTFDRLGCIAIEQGNATQGMPLLHQALHLYRTLENRLGVANALTILGAAATTQGDYAQAASDLEESLAIFTQVESKEGRSWVLGNLGHLALQQGDYDRAQTFFRECTLLRHELKNLDGVVWGLDGLAQSLLMQQKVARAVCLIAAATVIRNHIGASIPPIYQAEYQERMERARHDLGEDEFQRQWAMGSQMTVEQAVQMALQS